MWFSSQNKTDITAREALELMGISGSKFLEVTTNSKRPLADWKAKYHTWLKQSENKKG
jgi:hypothetical protein